jgi:hypothetical protein
VADSCPNCGYCKHCGRSDAPKPAPYRYEPFRFPYDDMSTAPWFVPYVRPYIWVGGPAEPNVTVTWAGDTTSGM